MQCPVIGKYIKTDRKVLIDQVLIGYIYWLIISIYLIKFSYDQYFNSLSTDIMLES